MTAVATPVNQFAAAKSLNELQESAPERYRAMIIEAAKGGGNLPLSAEVNLLLGAACRSVPQALADVQRVRERIDANERLNAALARSAELGSLEEAYYEQQRTQQELEKRHKAEMEEQRKRTEAAYGLVSNLKSARGSNSSRDA